ncbi:DUF6783 domain-containing protein [Blautia acetigignens]|uniref:DUF6783 domain-containing protein n=1 Tax=Blautia acetigignens TaxID=2981783 RepID=UPI003D74916C
MIPTVSFPTTVMIVFFMILLLCLGMRPIFDCCCKQQLWLSQGNSLLYSKANLKKAPDEQSKISPMTCIQKRTECFPKPPPSAAAKKPAWGVQIAGMLFQPHSRA